MIRQSCRDPREIAQNLAMKGYAKERIRRKLKARGMAHRLDDDELLAIMREVKVAKAYHSRRPSRMLPRVIGLIAIILGIGAVMTGANNQGTPTTRYYSPVVCGFAAIILGLILILKPGWSKTRIK